MKSCLSDEEDPESYSPGGYLDARQGEVYADRYLIEAKLGWGYFSTVYIATDYEAGELVALKMQKASFEYALAGLDEALLLRQVADKGISSSKRPSSPVMGKHAPANKNKTGVIEYLDHFLWDGPNGRHVCFVFELLGPNLLCTMRSFRFQGLSVGAVKRITAQVLNGLHFLHQTCGIIHTDLKPENVALTASAYPPPVLSTEALIQGKALVRGRLIATSADPEIMRLRVLEMEHISKKPRTSDHQVVDRTAVPSIDDPTVVPLTMGRSVRPSCPPGSVSGRQGFLYDHSLVPLERKQLIVGPQGFERQLQLKLLSSDVFTVWRLPKNSQERLRHSELLMRCLGWDPRKRGTPLDTPLISRTIKPGSMDRWERLTMTYGQWLGSVGHPVRRRRIYYSAVGPINTRDLNQSLAGDTDSLLEVDYKIVDLGNACWIDRHFADGIQTREYRCPEVITGAGYDQSADMWSLAAMVFELLSGHLLFDPRPKTSGKTKWTTDEDHCALIQEVLGPLPPLVTQTEEGNAIFDSNGKFWNISELRYSGMTCALFEKWKTGVMLDPKTRFSNCEAAADFLVPLLALDPSERASALTALTHPWLRLAHTTTRRLAPGLRSCRKRDQLIANVRSIVDVTDGAQDISNVRLLLLGQGLGLVHIGIDHGPGCLPLELAEQWLNTLRMYAISQFVQDSDGNVTLEGVTLWETLAQLGRDPALYLTADGRIRPPPAGTEKEDGGLKLVSIVQGIQGSRGVMDFHDHCLRRKMVQAGHGFVDENINGASPQFIGRDKF